MHMNLHYSSRLQEDIVCLSSGLEDESAAKLSRGYLAAEGYGARLGHLEPDRTGEVDRVSVIGCAEGVLLAFQCGSSVLLSSLGV